MKYGLASFAIVASLYANPALAQEQTVDEVMSVQTPSISESILSQPDWYRKFTVDDQIQTQDIWKLEPENDASFVWNQGNRWQLNVDLLSRDELSPLPREEMQAGANFQITPRFSIGGELSVGANELDDSSKWEDQRIEGGVRLKSAFKF